MRAFGLEAALGARALTYRVVRSCGGEPGDPATFADFLDLPIALATDFQLIGRLLHPGPRELFGMLQIIFTKLQLAELSCQGNQSSQTRDDLHAWRSSWQFAPLPELHVDRVAIAAGSGAVMILQQIIASVVSEEEAEPLAILSQASVRVDDRAVTEQLASFRGLHGVLLLISFLYREAVTSRSPG